MLDSNFIKNNLEMVARKVALKNAGFDREKFLTLDQQRRELIIFCDQLKSEKNRLVKEIAERKRNKLDSQELEEQTKRINATLCDKEDELEKVESEFKNFLLTIPNIFDDSVPEGSNSSQNLEIRRWKEPTQFDFEPKAHWDFFRELETFDFVRATKISGTRFALSFDNFARLERALMNFMLDTHIKKGYKEVLPPFLVNEESLITTGNLPKFKADLFKIENYNYFLVPTAEVPLTNIFRDEILDEKQLPLKFVAYTPCFRSEAGSYGKDVRGLIRLHQFNKVELLKFTTPESSYQELESLTADAEAILRALELPYRVVLLCSGDMSFSSAKTYDLEVWMPSRKSYVEISSCSNFESFQARRGRIRFKTAGGRKDFVHTLNGSGLAIGRTVAAIIENYQTAGGRVKIPEVLKQYFNNEDYLF